MNYRNIAIIAALVGIMFFIAAGRRGNPYSEAGTWPITSGTVSSADYQLQEGDSLYELHLDVAYAVDDKIYHAKLDYDDQDFATIALFEEDQSIDLRINPADPNDALYAHQNLYPDRGFLRHARKIAIACFVFALYALVRWFLQYRKATKEQ